MRIAETAQTCRSNRPQRERQTCNRSGFSGCSRERQWRFAGAPASAQTDVKFALDWKFEGPSAPYFVAIDKGYYKAEGLNVTIDSGPGSVAGIARVAAGTYPIGFFDINSLVKFQDQNPDKKVVRPC